MMADHVVYTTTFPKAYLFRLKGLQTENTAEFKTQLFKVKYVSLSQSER